MFAEYVVYKIYILKSSFSIANIIFPKTFHMIYMCLQRTSNDLKFKSNSVRKKGFVFMKQQL